MKQSNSDSIYPKGRAPIRPELVAGKLAAIRNHHSRVQVEEITRQPRLVEMLWFIQSMSCRPGNLVKFCEDMLEELPDCIGTPTLRASRGKPLSFEAKVKIYREMASRYWLKVSDEDGELLDLMAHDFQDGTPGNRTVDEDRRRVTKVVAGWTTEAFEQQCKEAALSALPELLTSLCVDKDRGFEGVSSEWHDAGRFGEFHSQTWFMDDLIGTIFRMMDIHARRASERLAMTKVAELIFDRLDYALAERVMVRIEGGSRFGKTEAISAWVEMRPGLARLVRVPCNNSMHSLFERIAEAFGIDCSYGSNRSRLKERVEYIIQHSGLFLIFDEGHWLLPLNFTATTPPHRINWVRTEIVDRGLPLAIAMTPQAFQGAVGRFVKKTGYDMTQFYGRDFLPLVLPETLSVEDLKAVARIHFPEMSENALEYIANEARLERSYLQAVEAISKRARYLAAKRGSAVKVADLKAAVADVLVRPAPDAASDREAGNISQLSISAPANEPLTLPESRVKGAFQAMRNSNLDSCSLRDAGRSRRAETELESVEA